MYIIQRVSALTKIHRQALWKYEYNDHFIKQANDIISGTESLEYFSVIVLYASDLHTRIL